jgi:hypothetical protein
MKRFEYVALAIAALVLAAEVIVYSPLAGVEAPSATAAWTRGRLRTVVQYSLSAGAVAGRFRVVTVRGGRCSDVTGIFVLADENHRFLAPRNLVDDFIGHFAEALARRKILKELKLVRAEELKAILAQTAAAPGRVVVNPTGALPVTVFSRSTDLLSPWVRTGGVLIWLGGPFAYFSAVRGSGPISESEGIHPGEEGVARFFNPEIVGPPPPGLRLNQPSEYAAALGLSYEVASRGPFRTAAVLRMGGKVLGYLGSGVTNIAAVPVENGYVIHFAGELEEGPSLAEDVAQIIWTTVYCTDQIEWREHRLRRFASVQGEMALEGGGSDPAVFFAFRAGPGPGFYVRIAETVPASRGGGAK